MLPRFHRVSATVLLGLSVLLGPLGWAATKVAPKPGVAEKASKPADASPGFQIGPIPSWVEEIAVGSERGNGGIYYRLLDEQVLLEAQTQTHYARVVKQVNDNSGLGSAGTVRVVFDPGFERLSFHRIEIQRGSQRLNALDRSRIQLLQRETNLEQLMYDGRVTAMLTLQDLRVGDVIDLAYSIRGANPVFRGKYVNTAWMMASEGATLQARFRLLAPEQRSIQYRPSVDTEVATRQVGGLRETVFLRKNVAQWQGDAITPQQYYVRDQVRLSEFQNWNEVAVWAAELFASAHTEGVPAVVEVANRIRAQSSQTQEQVRLALDFVQKEVRYFGTEVGPYSHQPALAAKVLAQRFGDCKDKTALLISLLRELNVAAQPVLASLRMRETLDDSFATPLAFDHAIARVAVGDRSYWLDGTRAMQTGPLARRESGGLGKMLVLEPGAQGLSNAPAAALQERVEVEDVLEVSDWKSTPKLRSTTTYFGEAAEQMRYARFLATAENTRVGLSKELVRVYPALVEDGAPTYQDVADDNAIRVTQNYSVPGLWKFPEQKVLVAPFALWGLIAPVRFSNEVGRTRPVQIGTPGLYRHTFRLKLPEAVLSKPSTRNAHEKSRQLDLQLQVASEATGMSAVGTLRILNDQVNPAEWTAYTEFLRKQENNLWGTFFLPILTASQGEHLRKEIVDTARSWDSMFTRDKPKTRVQSDARIKVMVLSSQLDSVRLPLEFRAVVLRERGVQFDHLGRLAQAKADFEQALALAPKDKENYTEAMMNAFLMEDDERSAALASKSLELGPGNAEALRMQSRLSYFKGDYAQAKASLLEALKNGTDHFNGYGLIELALISKRLKEDARANLATYYTGTRTEWPYPILDDLLAEGTGPAAKSIGVAQGQKGEEGNLCEAYYYAAEDQLQAGHTEQAQKLYQKSIDTGIVEFIEHGMSKRRLKGL